VRVSGCELQVTKQNTKYKENIQDGIVSVVSLARKDQDGFPFSWE